MNRSTTSLRRLPVAILFCGITLALAIAPVAMAARPTVERVYVGDLNLGTPTGQRTMQRRVDAAIEKVCVPHSSALAPNVRARRQLRDCRDGARQGVQIQLKRHGLPLLAAT